MVSTDIIMNKRIVLKVTLNIIDENIRESIKVSNRRRKVNFIPYTKVIYLTNNPFGDFSIYEESVKNAKRLKKKEFNRVPEPSIINISNISDIVDFINRIYIIPNAKAYSINEISRGLLTSVSPLLYIGDKHSLQNIEIIDNNSIIGKALLNKFDDEANIQYKDIKFVDFGIDWNVLRKNVEDASDGIATLLDRYKVYDTLKVYFMSVKGTSRSAIPIEMYLSYDNDEKLVYSMTKDGIDKIGKLALSFEYVHCCLGNRINIPQINSFNKHEQEVLLNGRLIPIYATPVLK